MREAEDGGPLEALGGEAALRAIIRDFVGRMTSDLMIGFFFAGVDRAQLEAHEYAFTARMLGAEVPYTGRPLREAHARHPIMGGQFDRRKQLLRETLRDHAVPAAVAAPWLAHVEALRGAVTRDGPGECAPGSAETQPSPRE
jgi:hemoglobin